MSDYTYINIKDTPSSFQRQTILQSSELLNSKLQFKGYDELKFLTIGAPSNIDEIYGNELNLIGIINSLLGELELAKNMNISNEKLLNESSREKEQLKLAAELAEDSKRKNERILRDIEVENLKLKFNVEDLKERKKGVEHRIREIRNEWETYRSQAKRDKRIAEMNQIELLDKLKSRKDRRNNDKGIIKLKYKKDSGTAYSEIIMNLLKEKNNAQSDFFKLYGLNKNLYNCLEKLKASDGISPIDSTFLIDNSELDELIQPIENIPSILDEIDAKFVYILNDIKSEPFGSDDTFRSKRIGVEKQREILMLKEQLKNLQESYDKVVNTMKEWKEWRKTTAE